jgi:hypothetical protein
MFRNTLLVTSALVVASSVAFASQHVKLPHGQTLQGLTREFVSNKMPGVVFSKNNTPIAVRSTVSVKGAHGKDPIFVPGGTGNFSKSKNALFLSWFGWFAGATSEQLGPSTYSACYSYSGGGNCISGYYERISEKINIQQSGAQPVTGITGAKEIQIGAEQYSGSGGAKVALYTDAGGVPGTRLGGGAFNTAPAYTGMCCSGLQTVKIKPAITGLNPSSQYWVVVSKNGTGGRVAWNGQDSTWASFPTGEDYNETGTTVENFTYKTYRSGYHDTVHTTFHSSTGGWIHTSSFSWEASNAAFNIK